MLGVNDCSGSVMDPLQDRCGFEEVQPLQHPHEQLQDVHTEAHWWTTKQMVLGGWIWW